MFHFQLRDMEDDADRQREKFEKAHEASMDRAESLNQQNLDLNQRYQTLLDDYRRLQSANLGLSQELATYNTLLSGEEER